MAMIKSDSILLFPEKSHRGSDQTFTWNEVKAIMDKEIKRRTEYVTAVVLATQEKFGDGALDVAAEAIYQIGYKKGKARSEVVAEQGQDNNLESLSKLIAHKMSKLYLGTTTSVDGDQLTVRETYCPLPVYWQSIGMSDDDVVKFCKIFDQVDKGMVEGYNSKYTTDLGGAEELALNGFCQMIVRQK